MFVVVALVQFNVAGASVSELAFLKVTTTTKVFADGVTERFVVSERGFPLKVEAGVNSLSTRAIWARAGAANRSKATPQSNGARYEPTALATDLLGVFMSSEFMGLKVHTIAERRPPTIGFPQVLNRV